ncbi:E3 ubiquitin-protein ligase ubr3 [Homalodisca vitripennis]|nr:E3 ubiquitin-protein ligase ubr3 [Homalodisca vitripennis]
MCQCADTIECTHVCQPTLWRIDVARVGSHPALRRYDNATTCGLVWTANFVAYRCRTCGISPCMLHVSCADMTMLRLWLVWTANFVAYRCRTVCVFVVVGVGFWVVRCRTCGISPCMSLCAECFQKGDHDGHDFNMFRSQAGGACDCGDTSVMKETG